MIQLHDMIVDIPENRVKFFGTTGSMLLPGKETVKQLLRQIPMNRLVTTKTLRLHLAKQFNVEAVCPVTLRKVLIAIVKESDDTVPYWRVINQNGSILVGQQTSYLLREGFPVISGNHPHILDFQISLYTFED